MCLTASLGLDKISVEVDPRGCIAIDDQYNSGVKCIQDVTLRLMLAHKAEEEGISAVEGIVVEYTKAYAHPEVAGCSTRSASSRSRRTRPKTNLDTEG